MSSQKLPQHLLQLVQLAKHNHSLKLTKQAHAQIHSMGFHQNPIILTNLINAYSHSQNPLQSLKLFNTIRLKDVYLYNTLMSAFTKHNLFHQSFDLFNEMSRSVDCLPDGFTFSVLAKVSGLIGDFLVGKWVHGKSVKCGFEKDIVLMNSLMSMYGKCGVSQESRKLFDEMPQRSVSSWNVMLSGYVDGETYRVWGFFKEMLDEGFRPNEFTLSNLLPLCGSGLGKFDYGRELHCYIIRNGMDLDVNSGVHLDCCLIDMYSRFSKVSLARLIFNRTRFKNVFVWTAMMNCYLQNGDPEETVCLFREMLRNVVEPNEVSVLTLLSACNIVAGLLGVEQIHAFSVRIGFADHTSLCNSLIDMYSKNGVLSYARQVFHQGCLSKDVITWSSMILGYGLHGKGQEAVDLYDKMIANGVKPDTIVVVGVLSACSRSGLTEKGLDIYKKAINVYGIEPNAEMCSCVVNLFRQSGKPEKALTFIKGMPSKPGPGVWGALVSSLDGHTDTETKVLGYRSLMEIEPDNPSNYVGLANLYATSGKWTYAADVRRAMRDRGLKKSPGCSWISINSKTHSFCVSDRAHPASNEIYETLNELILMAKSPGPDSCLIGKL
uniref:pentatricopeptide repeat-containing protein At3g12770 n=1 Tax=Erigeron canadensis TaxID=72917 RepID=UPI001CB8D60B|nr:pentatricopeptide repeat-containing protein At3g12770 [Erigeron canadensis]